MTVRNFRTPFAIEPSWRLETTREADGTTERACYFVELDPSRNCARSFRVPYDISNWNEVRSSRLKSHDFSYVAGL